MIAGFFGAGKPPESERCATLNDKSPERIEAVGIKPLMSDGDEFYNEAQQQLERTQKLRFSD